MTGREKLPGPADFPVLHTVKSKLRTRSPFHVCRVCGLAVAPRNGRAHNKACARRKRLRPEMWWEWYYDIRETPLSRRTRLVEYAAASAPVWTKLDAIRAAEIRALGRDASEDERFELAVLRRRETSEAFRLRRLARSKS